MGSTGRPVQAWSAIADTSALEMSAAVVTGWPPLPGPSSILNVADFAPAKLPLPVTVTVAVPTSTLLL